MKKYQKVRPVDEFGVYLLPSLKEWKLKNPGKLWFHSPFEQRCYVKLKNRNWEFECQPQSIELVPEFKALTLFKGKIIKKKVQDAVYTPDFLIKTKSVSLLIECKGFYNDLAKIRFKLCQYTLSKTTDKVILIIKSDLEFDKMLSLIDAEFNFQKTKKLKL
jgi:hypothetical protein